MAALDGADAPVKDKFICDADLEVALEKTEA
jgi:hypothetical protein